VSEAVAVLGMHRSGTSCLTGLLEQAGVFLGTVATKSGWNARGNRENPQIMQLHEDLLGVNGGSWEAPPASVVWPAELRLVRDRIIRGHQHAPVWGFKDPRTLLVLEGWLAALPALYLVGVLRHPLLVAESLQRRNGFSLEKGLELWRVYNEKLLAFHGRFKFPILSFDDAAFTDKVARLTAGLPLATPRASPLDFFDPDLRHAAPSTDRPLADETERLYLTLREIAA